MEDRATVLIYYLIYFFVGYAAKFLEIYLSRKLNPVGSLYRYKFSAYIEYFFLAILPVVPAVYIVGSVFYLIKLLDEKFE